MNPTLKVFLSELKRKVKNKACKNMEDTYTFAYITILSIYAVSYSYIDFYISNSIRGKIIFFSNQTFDKQLRDFGLNLCVVCCGSILKILLQ